MKSETGSSRSHPENQLVLNFIQGDSNAFEVLVRAESLRLRRYISRYVRSADVTDDIFQETWFRAWRKRDQLRLPEKFLSWIYQISRNCIHDTLRSQNWRIEIVLYDGSDDPEVIELEDIGSKGPRHEIHLSQCRTIINEEVQKLSPQAQEIIALRYSAGLSLVDVSEQLNIQVGTTYSLMSRSLAAMRKGLVRRGYRTFSDLDWFDTAFEKGS